MGKKSITKDQNGNTIYTTDTVDEQGNEKPWEKQLKYRAFSDEDKKAWKSESNKKVIKDSLDSEETQRNIDQVIQYAGGAANRRPSWTNNTLSILLDYGSTYFARVYEQYIKNNKFWQIGGKTAEFELLKNEQFTEEYKALQEKNGGPLCYFCNKKIDVTKDKVDIHHASETFPKDVKDRKNNMIGTWRDRREALVADLNTIQIPYFLEQNPDATREQLYDDLIRPAMRKHFHKPGLYASHKDCHRDPEPEEKRGIVR